MNALPKRKPIRVENYDYSTPGTYFITVCTANREKSSGLTVGANCVRPLEQRHYPINNPIHHARNRAIHDHRSGNGEHFCTNP